MKKREMLAVVFGIALMAGAVAADDADVKRAIEHDLVEEGIRTVGVEVSAGNVTLTGEADSAWEKMRAEELALDHREIESVVNNVTVAATRSDETIASDIARRLRNYVHYSIFDDVNIHVQGGVVTLRGDVTWGYKAEEMAKMAARVAGVQRVENEIEVLPASSNDQQLRQALASRIYGDAAFFRYSTEPVPPLHIIVENGRVTLTGVVDTPVQKRRAEQIARQTFGVFSVDNQLQLASES